LCTVHHFNWCHSHTVYYCSWLFFAPFFFLHTQKPAQRACPHVLVTLRPYLVLLELLNLALCKKKILRHIKLTVHAWSTKYKQNKKNNCTVWLYFARRTFWANLSIVGQYQTHTKCYSTTVPNSAFDTVEFSQLNVALFWSGVVQNFDKAPTVITANEINK
jgi:hypothetical protein